MRCSSVLIWCIDFDLISLNTHSDTITNMIYRRPTLFVNCSDGRLYEMFPQCYLWYMIYFVATKIKIDFLSVCVGAWMAGRPTQCNAQSNMKYERKRKRYLENAYCLVKPAWYGEADLNYKSNYDQMTKTRTDFKFAFGDGNLGIMLCDNSKLCGSTQFSLSNYNQPKNLCCSFKVGLFFNSVLLYCLIYYLYSSRLLQKN